MDHTIHEPFIRQALELAISAAKHGNHPFGALLVRDGQVLLTAENTVNAERDPTRHAELNLVVKAQRQFPEEILEECTLYTSTAPCMLCGAAIFEAGIRRIVYSVSYAAFSQHVARGYRTLPIDELFSRLEAPLELTGPVLEEQGLQVFQYWPKQEVKNN